MLIRRHILRNLYLKYSVKFPVNISNKIYQNHSAKGKININLAASISKVEFHTYQPRNWTMRDLLEGATNCEE